MIGRLMVQMVVVSVLLTLAALAAERLLRLWRRQARAVWLVAMAASLALPLFALAQALGLISSLSGARSIPAVLGAPIAMLSPRVTLGTGTSAIDVAIALCWAAISLGLTMRFARAARALRRERSAWRSALVDGERLLVSRDSGPAVIGFRMPTIVIPEWVLGLDETLRALVLRHEREHLDRGDPRLLLSGIAVAVLAPWNPVIWLQLHRLRCAMELDCDLRVLRAHPDVRRYGSLLLAVAQRADRGVLFAAALTESSSLLGRRIAAMRAPIGRHRVWRSVVLGAAASVVVIVACEMQSPTEPRVRPVASRPAVQPADQPYFEFQVEQAVTVSGSVQPRYPDVLRRAGVEGEVLVQIVVGPDGLADVGTLKVLKSSDELFTQSVRNALQQMQFNPAKVGGRPVRQLVQAPFAFTIAK